MTILYHAAPRLFSLKALIALEEKGVPFEARAVDGRPLDLAIPGYPPTVDQRLNLEFEGPVLVEGDDVIVSSFFLLEYVAERYAGPALLPGDPLGRYAAQGIGQLVAGSVAPFVSGLALAAAPLPETDGVAALEPAERRAAWAEPPDTAGYADKLRPTIARLEALLTGAWFLPDYSIADIDVFAMLRDLPTLAPGLIGADTPRLAALLARMEERPAVRRALAYTSAGPAYLAGPEPSRWG